MTTRSATWLTFSREQKAIVVVAFSWFSLRRLSAVFVIHSRIPPKTRFIYPLSVALGGLSHQFWGRHNHTMPINMSFKPAV
jgi:hypothetical protein